jgi:A/G-specific adenine glycosylase
MNKPNNRDSIALLLNWYDREGRQLPWRETIDPYPVLLSEIMLQQTQVSRVLPFYERWLERFPTWAALAEAPVSEVIRLWSGLGYNRRALALQNIARHIRDNGEPQSEAEWRAFKGIGAYTAAALAVFTLGVTAIPIDTNIRRAGGRVWLGTPFPGTGQDKNLHEILQKVLKKRSRVDDVFQALFDLASLICRKIPLCSSCPLSGECAAHSWFRQNPEATPPATGALARERKHADKPFPDRIYRGRLLKLAGATKTGISLAEAGPAIDQDYQAKTDKQWLSRMITRLIADGLLEKSGNRLHLPGSP